MNDQAIRNRSKWLRLLLLIGLTCLVIRLGYIQFFKSDAWAKEAQDIWRQKAVVEAARGTIYDRTGKKLAYTTVAYDIQADLKIMKAARDEVANSEKKSDKKFEPWQGDPQIYAQKLAPLLKMSEDNLVNKLTTEGQIGVLLKQTVDSDTADKIDKLGLKGIFLTKTSTRIYPNSTLAAHVLGFVTKNDQGGIQGSAGIELQYDQVLRGENGLRKFLKDSTGNPLPYEQEELKPAVDGKDIRLTIDETIQHYAEDALDHLVQQYKPENASIVVADPNTGEILALANRPTYNPNKIAESEQKVLDNNRAVNSAFEPGSTFKIVTLTAALAEKKASLNEQFASGRIQVQGQTIRDWNNGEGWGAITYRQGMEHSSNVGMVVLSQRLGWNTLYDYINKFGFNQKTGIDLPGEGNSILFTPDQKSELNLATTSFGQGISVTPMQQIAAVSAVANGGKVMMPYLMKEIRDPKTDATIQEQKPKVISEVATPEVMATMRDVMEDIVNSDTTKAGYIDGYRIAGKTGTAQIAKPTGGYYTDKYNCSFIGFAPADSPKVLVYVTVDSPNNNLQFGNIVATPFAKEVFGNVLPYLGLSSKNESNSQPKQIPSYTYTSVPNWVGMNRNQALQAASANQLQLQIIGSGDKITTQWPEAGMKVAAGSKSLVIAGNAKNEQGNVQVPDLTGKSMREALEILSILGLEGDAAGSGYVTLQEPKADAMIPAGSKIKLTFGPGS